MEFIYSLTGQRKLALYDEANSVTAFFIEKSKNTGWTFIERDYRTGLDSVLFEDGIYIAYISVADEIIVKRVGEGERLVMLADPNNALNIRNIRLMETDGALYVLYVTTNAHTDEDELWYAPVAGERKSIRLAAFSEKIQGYGIWKYNGKTYLILSCGEKDRGYILLKNDGGIYIGECGRISEYEKRLAEYEKGLAEYGKQLEEYEAQYKKQYGELADLTKQIQAEGKRWRELYYKSVKKNPT